MKKLIEEVAIACNVSERKLRTLLVEVGLLELLNNARRLQAGEAFKEKRILFQGEPIPAKYFKQAYENLLED
ncbi:hypothetical protein KGW14_004679 [Salmonella enterica subsp. enterica serovar Stanley]|uniref:Uncharacterized protein n=1 Tax=Salmonella enterica subsp. enterica serovar Stanley TaxID=192953 RepID=A0A736URL8_SALET|nr:hypothetical protein [Salmonella enterica subsp. enterica serovar Stanley]HAE7710286.1 hypothetical protein [Salmonella enterica subsp. enterica serovar Stanley]HCJ8659416.1 hypothetical protein [Escherichia coli]